MNRFILVLVFLNIYLINAQTQIATTGPVIENYGKVFKVDNPDLLLDKNTNYKVLFDIYTDDAKKNKPNPLLITVAQFLNMHAQTGVPVKNMQLVAVLHRAATKNVLSDEAYFSKFKKSNPNNGLIKALHKANVEIYVCGQSFLAKNYKPSEKLNEVKIALSALTVLTEYQSKGFQIINFN